MGTMWEIVDTKNQRRFMLGKGWWGVSRMGVNGPMALAEVVSEIEGPVFHKWPREHDPDAWRNFACNVWAFCEVAGWMVEVVAEPEDEVTATWPLVGGRWSPLDQDPCAEQTLAALERAGK